MAAFKRMHQVGMKAENCLLRYRALKADLTSSSSYSKELLKKKRSHPDETENEPRTDDMGDVAAVIRDEWERMDKIRKKSDIDIAKHLAALEKRRSEMNDFYKFLNEARKKEQRKFLIVFSVIINAIFVAAAIGESYQRKKRKKRVHGRSP